MTESMSTMTQVSVPQNQPWICLITPFIFATVNLQILKLAIFLKGHIVSVTNITFLRGPEQKS